MYSQSFGDYALIYILIYAFICNMFLETTELMLYKLFLNLSSALIILHVQFFTSLSIIRQHPYKIIPYTIIIIRLENENHSI